MLLVSALTLISANPTIFPHIAPRNSEPGTSHEYTHGTNASFYNETHFSAQTGWGACESSGSGVNQQPMGCTAKRVVWQGPDSYSISNATSPKAIPFNGTGPAAARTQDNYAAAAANFDHTGHQVSGHTAGALDEFRVRTTHLATEVGKNATEVEHICAVVESPASGNGHNKSHPELQDNEEYECACVCKNVSSSPAPAPAPVQQGFCLHTHTDNGNHADSSSGVRTCDSMTATDGIAFHMDNYYVSSQDHSAIGPADWASGGKLLYFCCHNRTTELTFPAGTYCLTEQEFGCPAGFQRHAAPLYTGLGNRFSFMGQNLQSTRGVNSIKTDASDHSIYSDVNGAFCCRNDGPAGTAITMPFNTTVANGYQMLRNGPTCQNITGLSVTAEWRTNTFTVATNVSALEAADLGIEQMTNAKVKYHTCRYH